MSPKGRPERVMESHEARVQHGLGGDNFNRVMKRETHIYGLLQEMEISNLYSIFLCTFFKLFIYLFIYLEHTNKGEAERERIPSRLCTVSTEPDAGLNPTNCEIMT